MKKLILIVMCLVVLMCNGYAEEIAEDLNAGEIESTPYLKFSMDIDAKILDQLQDRLVMREEARQEVIRQVRGINDNLETKERQLERLNGAVLELREHIAELTDAPNN